MNNNSRNDHLYGCQAYDDSDSEDEEQQPQPPPPAGGFPSLSQIAGTAPECGFKAMAVPASDMNAEFRSMTMAPSGSIAEPRLQTNPSYAPKSSYSDPYGDLDEDSDDEYESAQDTKYTPPPPASEHRSGWNGAKLTNLPMFHPVEMCNAKLSLDEYDVPEILENITSCLRAMSVQANFRNEPLGAALLTKENVELFVSMWRSRTEKNTIIIEAQRIRGDSVIASRYCRTILESASGYFDESQFKRDSSSTLDIHRLEKTESLINQALYSQKVSSRTDEEQAVDSLGLVHAYLSSSRLDARHLGLESLCFLTDPRRTSINTAIRFGLAVLLGKAPTQETTESCMLVHKTIVRLVQMREFEDDILSTISETYMDVDSEAEFYFQSDEEGTRSPSSEYVEYVSQLFHLALTAMVNAVECIASFQNHALLRDINVSTMASDFLRSAKSVSNVDMLRTLMDCVMRAERKLHNAYLSAKGLKYLCRASPQVRDELMNKLSATKYISQARQIGGNSHALLQQESEQLWTALFAC